MIVPEARRERTGTDRQGGFSLVELLVAVAIIMTICAMAVFTLKPALQNADCDAAMQQVVGQLRQAREFAITNRRYVQVTFTTVASIPQINLTQRNDLTAGAGAINPVLSTVAIHAPEQFYFGGGPDTPDGLGQPLASAGIEFGGVSGGPVGGMLFQSDGELVDGTLYQPLSGTVFLGQNGPNTTSRAVTVLGATGRVRAWKGTGTGWAQY
ncbi:MAG: type II secretion system protein [Candidatus Acidiferrales bacterium]